MPRLQDANNILCQTYFIASIGCRFGRFLCHKLVCITWRLRFAARTQTPPHRVHMTYVNASWPKLMCQALQCGCLAL